MSNLKIICPPHLKVAIKVTEPTTVEQEARELLKMIKTKSCIPQGLKLEHILAIAQPQAAHQPKAFFVLNPELKELIKAFEGAVIINPHIISKNKLTRYMSLEGCLSYPNHPQRKVKRFQEIEVEYEVMDLEEDWLTGELGFPAVAKRRKALKGLPAIVFQHELQHLNGKSIWSK